MLSCRGRHFGISYKINLLYKKNNFRKLHRSVEVKFKVKFEVKFKVKFEIKFKVKFEVMFEVKFGNP